jgi:hypothetical protein
MRLDLLALFASLPFLLGACSLSNSSGSISDSVSSPFEWSSSSSGGGGNAYRDDVSDYTVAYLEEGGDILAFRRGVGQIAHRHGITNWEADLLTCASIGYGLRRAGIEADDIDSVADKLFAPAEGARIDLRAGYASLR